MAGLCEVQEGCAVSASLHIRQCWSFRLCTRFRLPAASPVPQGLPWASAVCEDAGKVTPLWEAAWQLLRGSGRSRACAVVSMPAALAGVPGARCGLAFP